MRYKQKTRKGKFKKYPRETISNKSKRNKYRNMKRFTAPKCYTARWWCYCCRPNALYTCNISKIQRAYDKRQTEVYIRESLDEYVQSRSPHDGTDP